MPQVTVGSMSAASIHDVVVMRVRHPRRRTPAGDGGVPVAPCRRVGAALEVGEGLGVRVDVAAARAALDRHVADGHALLHRHAVEDIAGVFVGVADAAVGAEQADDVEDDVLGVDAGAGVAVDLDAADLEFGPSRSSAWRARRAPGWCRCRRRSRRTRRGWRCASRRRRWWCRAG
jgi:hypothetical protein